MTRIQDTLDMSWLSDVLVGIGSLEYQHPVTGGGLIIFIVGELMGSQNGIVRMKCSVYFYSNGPFVLRMMWSIANIRQSIKGFTSSDIPSLTILGAFLCEMFVPNSICNSVRSIE